MALEYWDGFDDVTGSQLTRYWTGLYTVSGNSINLQPGTLTNTTGRYSPQAIITNGSCPGGTTENATNQATRTLGAAINLQSCSQTSPIFMWVDSSSIQCCLCINVNGTLAAYQRSQFGTLLGTSTNALQSQIWYYIEATATINNSTGSIVVNVNGIQWLNLIGKNTTNSGNNYCNLVCVGSPATQLLVWVDDFYVSNDSTMLGDSIISDIYPNGVGASTQFTKGGSTINANNYQQVNEATPDDDTTYVYTPVGGVGNIDLYTYQSIPTTTGTIHGVMACPMMRNDAGGLVTAQTVYRISGTNFLESSNNLNASYTGYPDVQLLNPNTSSAWTVADVNAIQAGIKRTA